MHMKLNLIASVSMLKQTEFKSLLKAFKMENKSNGSLLLLLILLEQIATADASIWKIIYPNLLLLLEEHLTDDKIKKKNDENLELHPFQIRKKETSKSGICLPSVPLFNNSLTIIDRKICLILLTSLKTHRLAIYLYFLFPAFIKTSRVSNVVGNILGMLYTNFVTN